MAEKSRNDKDPALKDVQPGSDADAVEVAEPGKTPADPNKSSELSKGLKTGKSDT